MKRHSFSFNIYTNNFEDQIYGALSRGKSRSNLLESDTARLFGSMQREVLVLSVSLSSNNLIVSLGELFQHTKCSGRFDSNYSYIHQHHNCSHQRPHLGAF